MKEVINIVNARCELATFFCPALSMDFRSWETMKVGTWMELDAYVDFSVKTTPTMTLTNDHSK